MEITAYINGKEIGKVTGWHNIKIGSPSQTVSVYQGNILIYSNNIPM